MLDDAGAEFAQALLLPRLGVVGHVDLDREAMGRQAMKALLARIRQEAEPELHLDLNYRLVLRESTGPAKTGDVIR